MKFSFVIVSTWCFVFCFAFFALLFLLSMILKKTKKRTKRKLYVIKSNFKNCLNLISMILKKRKKMKLYVIGSNFQNCVNLLSNYLKKYKIKCYVFQNTISKIVWICFKFFLEKKMKKNIYRRKIENWRILLRESFCFCVGKNNSKSTDTVIASFNFMSRNGASPDVKKNQECHPDDIYKVPIEYR